MRKFPHGCRLCTVLIPFQVPGDKCWPSAIEWKTLDLLVGGKLIKSEPIARSCYNGPDKNDAQCQYVDNMWSDQDFQTSKPIGRPYPFNVTCPPVNITAGETPGSCILGSLPTYAVNATSRLDISSTLAFARKHNIRLTVASTGHDLLGRADGYGSLEIWLRHFRNSIKLQKKYKSANSCHNSGWDGSAVRIDGAWQWRDVHKIATKNKVIVVGGGSISPGATGGWPAGGGHGPASRNYGIGADQILEAEVMLADGRVVVANHCQNADLFKSLRGGGPGFGVVLGTTIKAYPDVKDITAHHFVMAPLENTDENKDLLDAVATLLQSLPDINDNGYAGYGYWFRKLPQPLVGNITSGYSHGIWTIGKNQTEAEAAWAPVREKLAKYKDKLFMHEDFKSYSDYWSFYNAESAVYDKAGTTALQTSRLFDRESLKDGTKVRDMVEVISGPAEQMATNVILLVSGGQVFKDAADTSSGLNPAWRKSNFAVITSRSLPKRATQAERQAITDDLTFVKGQATKNLAPDTAGYMNEGDVNDPDYIKSFYGDKYAGHLAVKQKYDPQDIFFCPTCVGAERFIDRPDGALCRK